MKLKKMMIIGFVFLFFNFLSWPRILRQAGANLLSRGDIFKSRKQMNPSFYLHSFIASFILYTVIDFWQEWMWQNGSLSVNSMSSLFNQFKSVANLSWFRSKNMLNRWTSKMVFKTHSFHSKVEEILLGFLKNENSLFGWTETSKLKCKLPWFHPVAEQRECITAKLGPHSEWPLLLYNLGL